MEPGPPCPVPAPGTVGPAKLCGSGHGPCPDCLLLLLSGWQRKDILAELTKSQKVFSEKLDHLSRRLAWVHATVYSQVSGAASAGSCSLLQFTDWSLTGLGGATPQCSLPSWASGTHVPTPSSSASLFPPCAITPDLFMPVNSSRCRLWTPVPHSSSYGPPREDQSVFTCSRLCCLSSSSSVSKVLGLPQPQSASLTPSIPCS